MYLVKLGQRQPNGKQYKRKRSRMIRLFCEQKWNGEHEKWESLKTRC